MIKILQESLTFDDVLLIPAFSSVLPNQTDVSSFLTQNIKLSIPIMSSAMDSVTESPMAIAMARNGGIGIIHKNMSIEAQVMEIKIVKSTQNNLLVGAAVGVGESEYKRAQSLIEVETDVLVVDTAHGHSQSVIEFIQRIKTNYPNMQVIGGNIVTKEAAESLINVGVNAVKVGVGPGSICTTRIVAGVGVPQLTAIMNISEICKKNKVSLIADGGIKYSGDIAKAIGAGADIVMLGKLLAGSDESPGDIIIRNNIKYKSYRGMGSIAAMNKGSADRYFQNASAGNKLVPEGIEGDILYKGSVNDILFQLVGGLKSAMGYTGNSNIIEMQNNTKFVKITHAGLIESHPHI